MTGAEKKLIGRFARLHQDVERGVVPRAADVTSMLRAAWAGKLLSAHGKPYEACLDLAFAETAGVARGKVRASLLAGLEGLLRHDISAMSHFRSTLDALAPEARRLAWATDYLESETCTSSEDARSIIDTLWTRKPARSTRLYLALLAAAAHRGSPASDWHGAARR